MKIRPIIPLWAMLAISAFGEDSADKIINSNSKVILKFEAPWCGACKILNEKLGLLQDDLSDISFLEIDVDQDTELKQLYGISHIPTLVIFKDGSQLGRLIGGGKEKEQILEIINEMYTHELQSEETELKDTSTDSFRSLARSEISQIRVTLSRPTNEKPIIRFNANGRIFVVPSSTISRYSDSGQPSGETAAVLAQAISNASMISIISGHDLNQNPDGGFVVYHLELQYRDNTP